MLDQFRIKTGFFLLFIKLKLALSEKLSSELQKEYGFQMKYVQYNYCHWFHPFPLIKSSKSRKLLNPFPPQV